MEVKKETKVPGEETLILRSHNPTDEERAEWGEGEEETVTWLQERFPEPEWHTNHAVTWYGHAGYSDATFYVKTQQEALDLIDALATIVGIEYD